MIISHDEKFVFVRNPKTATRSITDLLKNNVRVFECSDHHYWIIPEHCKNYFIFVFVRNPFTRCVSAYKHIMTDMKKKGHNIFDFEEFISRKHIGVGTNTMPVKNVFLQTTFINMVKKDSNIQNIKICKYENLSAEIKSMKFLKNINIPKIGESEDRDSWMNLYTPKVAQKLTEVASVDFENFGYSKNINDYNFTNRLLL